MRVIEAEMVLIQNDDVTITKRPRRISVFDRVIEDATVTVNNENLQIEGNELQYKFIGYHNHVDKANEIDDSCIEMVSMFGIFGGKKQRIANGWVFLKERKKVKITITKYTLNETTQSN